jgi:hypothetical protein
MPRATLQYHRQGMKEVKEKRENREREGNERRNAKRWHCTMYIPVDLLCSKVLYIFHISLRIH